MTAWDDYKPDFKVVYWKLRVPGGTGSPIWTHRYATAQDANRLAVKLADAQIIGFNKAGKIADIREPVRGGEA